MPKVFISYSHEDKEMFDEFITHLKPYERRGEITVWTDKQINPGENWMKKIEQAFNASCVVVFLVSAHFLASKFINDIELAKALKRTREGRDLTIFWIAISASGFANSPLAEIQGASNPQTPLDNLTSPERHAEWVRITNKLVEATREPHCQEVLDIAEGNRNQVDDSLMRKNDDNQQTKETSISITRSNRKEWLLFGYFGIETDGKETILVENHNLMPIFFQFDPEQLTINEAIDEAVREFLDTIGASFHRLIRASILKVNWCVPYKLTNDKSTSEEIPYIFFKIILKQEIEGSASVWRNYAWRPKSLFSHTWRASHALYTTGKSPFDEDKLSLSDDPYHIIAEDWISKELGRDILECVDVIIFRKDIVSGDILFLVGQRAKNRKWEYVKGGIYYHETHVEAALREANEEAHILSSDLTYCTDLGVQTVATNRPNKFYNTLRVKGLVFLFTGNLESVRSGPGRLDTRWVKFDEAREMVSWLEGYAQEFFDRWKVREEEILKIAGFSG